MNAPKGANATGSGGRGTKLPLQGRIWRLGAMGYNAMKHKVLITLGALEAVLRTEGFSLPSGAAVDAAMEAWDA